LRLYRESPPDCAPHEDAKPRSRSHRRKIVMFYAFVTLLAVFGTFAVFRDWLRWKDVFHPTIFSVPQLLFLYVAFPIYGLSVDQYEFLSRAGYWDELANFQLLADLIACAVILGIWWGSRYTGNGLLPSVDQNSRAIFAISIMFGVLGLTAWLSGIINVGGFAAAYGRAYGGGWDDSGYVREAAQFGFIAAPLLILSRRRQRMRWQHWLLVLLFLAPLLVQGLLGARRGPTFLAITGVAAAYVLAFRPKIPFLAVVVSAGSIGLLLLWLVANRDALFLGSEKELQGSVSRMLENWAGNEYLFSSAIVRYVNEAGEPFYGLRVLAHMLGRVVPVAIWPTKYADVCSALGLQIDLTQDAGIPIDRINAVTGWKVAVGAAPGIVGDLWMEFGIFAPLAAFALGGFYGKLWQQSRRDPRLQPAYAMLAALSIYIFTQTIEAWLFRSLLFGIPALALLAILARRHKARSLPAQTWHVHALKRARAVGY
jgi:hypothetical protein